MSLRTLKPWALAAAVAVLSTTPALAALVDGFTFMPAPFEKRGKLDPIAADGAYGYTYLHEQGWYVVTVPRGGRTDLTSSGGRTFDMHTTQGIQVCSAQAQPQAMGSGFAQLQARVPDILRTWEADIGGVLQVQERAVMELKDDGAKHVRFAGWTGLDTKGRPLTLGVIEVPRGVLIIGCTGADARQSKFLTQMAFRLAEGAL